MSFRTRYRQWNRCWSEAHLDTGHVLATAEPYDIYYVIWIDADWAVFSLYDLVQRMILRILSWRDGLSAEVHGSIQIRYFLPGHVITSSEANESLSNVDSFKGENDGVVVHERSPEECDEAYTSPYHFGAIRFQNVLSCPPWLTRSRGELKILEMSYGNGELTQSDGYYEHYIVGIGVCSRLVYVGEIRPREDIDTIDTRKWRTAIGYELNLRRMNASCSYI